MPIKSLDGVSVGRNYSSLMKLSINLAYWTGDMPNYGVFLPFRLSTDVPTREPTYVLTCLTTVFSFPLASWKCVYRRANSQTNLRRNMPNYGAFFASRLVEVCVQTCQLANQPTL